jgi:hypothetical protein
MTAAKLSVEKAAFSNIFVGIRATVQELRAETEGWQGWDRATSEGFKQHTLKLRRLEMNEKLLHQLENLATVKKTRIRAGANGLKSRNLLVMCGGCGYKARITRMWLEVGVPKCPNPDCENFDTEMSQEEFFSSEGGTVGAIVAEHEAIHGTKPYQDAVSDPFLEEAGNLDDWPKQK